MSGAVSVRGGGGHRKKKTVPSDRGGSSLIVGRCVVPSYSAWLWSLPPSSRLMTNLPRFGGGSS